MVYNHLITEESSKPHSLHLRSCEKNCLHFSCNLGFFLAGGSWDSFMCFLLLFCFFHKSRAPAILCLWLYFLSYYSTVTGCLFFLLCILISLNALDGKLLFLLSVRNAWVLFCFWKQRKENSWIRLSRVFMSLGILKSSQILHSMITHSSASIVLNCYFKLYQLWKNTLTEFYITSSSMRFLIDFKTHL